MAYPRIRRDQASFTAQRYSLPSRVGCSVMSVSHSRFGRSEVKSRLTRSSCTGGPGRRDLPRLRACRDTRLACEHSRHIRRSETAWPASMTSSAMNRYPKPGSSAWTSTAALVA
ncbi:hypothetical protein ASD90_21815 [Terrabacter sp. Root181]|nr:hypothetical protein ASD90_21815 [Terrabacter sp. Root181]